MAAPSYSSDLTDIVVPPIATGDWGAFGGGASALNAETDYYLIDSTCLSKNAWAGDYKGAVFDNTTDVTIATGDALWVWLTHLTPNSLATEAAGGLRIVMADANTESSFDEWYVGGSDTVVYDDRWICAVADPDVTPDNNNGATENYSWFGAGANLPSGGPTKGAPFAINSIRHGREFQCIDGDLGNGYATFAGAATFDNASTRRLGMITFSKGVYTCQGLFVMGTASTAVDFRDVNRTLFVARTPKVQAGFNGFEVRNAASRVDWTNISITATDATSPGYFEMIDAADVNMTTCTFVDMGDFTFQSTGSAQSCTWRGCGQIIAAGADLGGSLVSGYEGTADTSALVWNVATNPDVLLDGMSFTKGTAATHAIEFGLTSPTAITLRDMTFTDYSGTGTSAAIDVLRTSGTVTITLVNTNQPSVQTAGATVEFETNPVDVTAKVVDNTGTNIQNARAFLYATSTQGTVLPVAESPSSASGSGTTVTVNFSAAHGLKLNDKIYVIGSGDADADGVFSVATVPSTTQITYTANADASGVSGTSMEVTYVAIEALTDVNGEITVSRSFTENQSIAGWARKSTTEGARYKQGSIVGTISSSADTTFTAVLISDE